MSFKKGDKVKQVQAAPIEGTVEGFAIDQETGESQILVSYSKGDEQHRRHFKADELTAG